MPGTRNIVRIFLASPGDLKDERLVAKAVVEEFNHNNADFLDYQVELLGWEDTVTQQGRAQSTINRDLLKCDLFVGMLGSDGEHPLTPQAPILQASRRSST